MKYKYRISGDDAAIFRVEDLPTGRLRFFSQHVVKSITNIVCFRIYMVSERLNFRQNDRKTQI